MTKRHSLQDKKVLITCGPTWIPIDKVRVISNISSGTLGQTMAKDLHRRKAKVTLLEGPVTTPLRSKAIKVLKYNYFDELKQLLKKELKKNFSIVIHAAAVSDYKLKAAQKKKISSSLTDLNLNLIPTIKMINFIKKISPKTILIGFKLEPDISEKVLKQKTSKLFEQANCDFVVANSLNNNKYKGFIIDKNYCILKEVHSRTSLSNHLIELLSNRI